MKRFALRVSAFGLLSALMFSCSPAPPQLMPKETLFTLELGTLEDQMDLFLRSGLPSPEKNRFYFFNGLFVISNGNARKVMEFSSYGDLLTIFYNPETNPTPLLANNDSQVRNRRAFSYPFNEIGEVALNAQNQLFVEDRVAPERRTFDPDLQIQLESRLLRFDKDGKLVDFLGQEGVGGTPLPALEQLSLSANGEIAVICRTGKGWVVFWYSPAGLLLYKTFLPYDKLPFPEGMNPENLNANIENLIPDRQNRSLHLKIDYYQKTVDAVTKSASGVQLVQSRVWTFELASLKFTENFLVPLLAREKTADATEAPSGDRPYEFLGVNDSGNFFFLSSLENKSQRFLVCDRQGKTVLERNIRLQGENDLFAQYDVSPQGVLAGMLSDGQKVEMAWWRSDKLLNTYGQAGF